MTNQDEDIFGQIDALLGKRSTAVLAEKVPNGDDFPLLTDVISNSKEVDSLDGGVSPADSPNDNSVQQQPLPLANEPESCSDISDISPGFFDRIPLVEMEKRWVEMFRLQQKSLEESFRKIVREELRRRDDN